MSISRAAKPARVFKSRCRAGGAPSIEERGGPDPHHSRGQPLSGRCPPPGGFSFRWNCPPARREQAGDGRGRRTRIPAPLAPTRFPAGASRLAGSSSEEGGLLESHGVTRASASNGARPLAGSPSVRWEVCAGRESNPHVERHTLLRRARLPVTPPARDARDRGPEPPPGVEPGRPLYESEAASRARRRGWPSWPRTRKLRVQSPAGLPNSPNGHRVRGTRAARLALAETAGLPSPVRAPPRIRTEGLLLKRE